MNIYHFIGDFKYGGVEIAAKSSLVELNNNNNFFIVSIGKLDSKLMNTLSDYEKTKILELNFRSLCIFNQIFLFSNFLKANPPDIFLFSLWKSSFLGLLLHYFYKNSLFISFIHSTRFVHILDKIFTKKAIKKFDYIFVDSKNTKDFVSGFSSNKNIEIVSFKILNYEGQIKTLNKNKINFLYIGRFSKHKRIDKSLDVIKKLVNKNFNITFNLYGSDDGEINYIKDKINKLNLQNNVYIHDAVNPQNLPEIFDKHNFYLQLSDFEGFAMSVCEAMQSGLVCCITPVGEIKNYSEDMYSAIHLKDNNMDDFVNKIVMLIQAKDRYEVISKNSLMKWKNTISYSNDLENKINKINK